MDNNKIKKHKNHLKINVNIFKDVEIMQRIYKDGALQRGIPGALVGGGLGWMFLKRLPSIGKIPKAIGMFLFGELCKFFGGNPLRRAVVGSNPVTSTLKEIFF